MISVDEGDDCADGKLSKYHGNCSELLNLPKIDKITSISKENSNSPQPRQLLKTPIQGKRSDKNKFLTVAKAPDQHQKLEQQRSQSAYRVRGKCVTETDEVTGKHRSISTSNNALNNLVCPSQTSQSTSAHSAQRMASPGTIKCALI